VNDNNTFRFLRTPREGAVQRVILNRPDVRNAFNEELLLELTRCADAIASDATVRCVVLSGEGPVFCAGADLAWMSRMASYTHEENIRDANAAARMFSAFDMLPVPVLGEIHGAALGGGVGLVAVCDVAVAEQDAVFGFTEVKLGIVPALISPYVLAKIGRSAARELFLTGRRFSAQRALEIGLVHSVVARGDLAATVQVYIQEILSAAPEAITVAKALIPIVWSRLAPDAIGLTVEAIVARRVSPEGKEGIRAFLEKRKARWNLT
jgi:methylglutaconyl-CoA hydratase